MGVKAIETRYKGYRFRSRLEARWAVFFDALGLRWEYETEGFDLGDAGYYLPDFWITLNQHGDKRYWIEIKPHRNLSGRELSVAVALAEHHGGYILFGQPAAPRWAGKRVERHFPTLYAIPELAGFPALDLPTWAPLTPAGGLMPVTMEDYHGAWGLEFSSAPVDEGDKQRSLESILVRALARMVCWHERADDGSVYLWAVPSNDVGTYARTGQPDPLKAGDKAIDSPRLLGAYEAARSARFEHGEQP